MSGLQGFGFAQARMQARLARLPSEADWHALAAERSLPSFLEHARAHPGAMQNWAQPYSALSRASDIEAGLRRSMTDQVLEVADWVPSAWTDAVSWVVWLPLVPLFEHLGRGGVLPGWVRLDPSLAPCLDRSGHLDPGLVERVGLSELLADPAGVAWLRLWRQRWPRVGSGSRARLERLVDEVAVHGRAFREAAPDTAWRSRRELRECLRRRFHASLLEPAGVFAYLGLILLDLERLRGELLDRALFAPAEAA